MIKSKTARILFPLAFVGLVTGTAACGDDGGGGTSKKPPVVKKKVAQAAVAAPIGAMSSYPKVDEELRHTFVEMDFVPDSSGDVNRDPFRSWVLRPKIDTQGQEVRVVDVCTEGNVRWGAPNYSVRDLELIGLVKRGRSYAQFTDRSEQDSWIVRKGDCIGQEKAIIEEVGVGFVSLSITPPAPPGAPAPPAQKQAISLHPDELEVADTIISDSSESEETQ